MTITPEIAEEMLATSVGNRRTREWYVSLLAAAMKRGEWRVTSQGIGFDVNGNMRDAHHRLKAVVKSWTTIQSVVVFGLRTDAYEVIDIGMMRTYADRLHRDPRVADVLRLGCAFAVGTAKPTIDQMRPFIEAGLGQAAETLTEFCGSRHKFYSSAPMKLAACVTVMDGGDADYVLGQYRALCRLDFDSMSSAAKALVRQVDSNKAGANNTRQTLARGLRVFDKDRASVTKIQVSDADIDAAVMLTKSVLRASLARLT